MAKEQTMNRDHIILVAKNVSTSAEVAQGTGEVAGLQIDKLKNKKFTSGDPL